MKRRSLLQGLGLGLGLFGTEEIQASVETNKQIQVPTNGLLDITNEDNKIVFSIDDKGNLYLAGDVIKAKPTVDPIRRDYRAEQNNRNRDRSHHPTGVCISG